MKFKVMKGTELFNEFEEFFRKRNEYNKLAFSIATELGFEKIAFNRNCVAGGIGAFYHEGKKEGYKTIGKPKDNCVFPNKNNTEVKALIDALPTIKVEEYNNIIGYKPNYNGEFISTRFASELSKCGNYYLLDIKNGSEFEMKEDMIEILESEYLNLKK
jgi:hypothetical protein